MTITKHDILSETICQQIDHWVAKYPSEQKQSAVLAALTIVQKDNDGWLTEESMNAVADYLEMPRVAVYEVATFYSMFDLNPVGRYKINVCTNISCMLRDSEKIVDYLQQCLGIKVGGTTRDGKFTLRSVECLAACVNAPTMQIDNVYYHDLTEKKIDKILKGFEKE